MSSQYVVCALDDVTPGTYVICGEHVDDVNLSNVSQPTAAGVLLHSLSQSFNSTSLERACVRNTRASSALWVYDNALYKLTFLLSNELVCAVISC